MFYWSSAKRKTKKRNCRSYNNTTCKFWTYQEGWNMIQWDNSKRKIPAFVHQFMSPFLSRTKFLRVSGAARVLVQSWKEGDLVGFLCSLYVKLKKVPLKMYYYGIYIGNMDRETAHNFNLRTIVVHDINHFVTCTWFVYGLSIFFLAFVPQKKYICLPFGISPLWKNKSFID